MQYTLLIYGDEMAGVDTPPDLRKQVMDEYIAYEGWLADKGIKRAGEALQDTNQATTVRTGGDGAMTTDGPFAETKEQLGGFYLLDCDNLDDALEAARQCPGSKYGSVEVRPVIDFSQMGGAQ